MHQATPFPSLADLGFLAQYPFLTIGVLLISGRAFSLARRARLFLDGLMVMTVAATFSWYFVLGPTMLQGGESLIAKIVGSAYPLWDIVILACVLLLFLEAENPMVRWGVGTLAVGLGVVVSSDSVFAYQTLHHTYATGRLVDIGWPLGDSLICLSAGMLAVAARRRESERADTIATPVPTRAATESPPAWRSLTPYALAPLVAALSVYTSEFRGDEQLQPGVYVGGAILLLTIFLRQVLALTENRRLVDKLQLAYWELGAKNSELSEANQKLQMLAVTDPLTELPNQRATLEALDQEIERGRRYGHGFAVLFIDLDHFKSVNDAHGHMVGDAILKEICTLMKNAVRAVDIVGRWGGEEFVAILPEVDSLGALSVSERIRECLAEHAFTAAPCHVTASIGMAAYPEDGDTRTALVDASDRAMYAAKRLGRNQGRGADDPLVAPVLEEGGVTLGTAALTYTVEGLSAMIAGRGQYTAGHISVVESLAARVGLALGVNSTDIATIKLASRLHDIGKVAVPDAVLLKPGRLNDDEWMLMRRHPIVGADVVSRIHGLGHLAPIIRSHHERWDGVSYPDGLIGNEIPLGARILAVTDVYAAMTQGRVYREARDPDWAIHELQRCAGSQFDPQVVEAFQRVLAADPDLSLPRRHAV